MNEHHHALAFAQSFDETATAGGDSTIGPIGRGLAIPALRELLEHVGGLIEDLEAGVTGLGPTAGSILATAIRAKATTDAANAFVNEAA